ncbi:MAG: DUF5011 domain-containing protein [Bacilli bacterium]|nr:DUF5011 domain-containing protein [Bacilli bacterium]
MKKVLYVLLFVVGLLLAFNVNAYATEVSGDNVEVSVVSIFDEDNQSELNKFNATYGNKLTVVPPSHEGYTFAFWVVNGVVRNDLPLDYEFVITKNLNLVAVFNSDDKNVVLFMDSNGKLLDTQFVNNGGFAIDPSDSIDLPSKIGYEVKSGNERWLSTDGKLLSDPIEANTVFILQYELVNTETFTVQVEGGYLLVNGEGVTSHDYPFNYIAVVNAEDIPGKKFSHFEEKGDILSRQSTYYFTVTSNRNIKAVYIDEDDEVVKAPLVIMSDPLPYRENYYTYISQFELPDNYELIEYGVITSTLFEELELSTPNITRYQVNKHNDITNEYVLSIPKNSHVMARAYLVVRNTTTNQIEYYHSNLHGLRIDGHFIPIYRYHIYDDVNNPVTQHTFDTITIHTNLDGASAYPVVVIVDSHGRIVKVRDCYNEQIDITHPIKTGHPDQVRGKANNVGWDTNTNTLSGITGPQGTEGGIPEGGFAIVFTSGVSTHERRQLALDYAREFGLKVELVNIEINGYQDLSADDVLIQGVEDITILKGSSFNPLEGVTAVDYDGSPVDVEVVFNNVDTNKAITGTTNYNDPTFPDGWYSVVYKATGKNGYSVHVTRRVKVEGVRFEGISNTTIQLGEEIDLMAGVKAYWSDGTDITDQIIIQGSVNTERIGTYKIKYKIIYENGYEDIVDRVITVKGDIESSEGAIIIHPQSKGYYSEEGTWQNSSNLKFKDVFVRLSRTANSAAIFTPNITEAGKYGIYYYSAFKGVNQTERPTRIEIYVGTEKIDTIDFNTTGIENGWHLVKEIEYNGEGPIQVKIVRNTDNDSLWTRVAAMAFVPHGSSDSD